MPTPSRRLAVLSVWSVLFLTVSGCVVQPRRAATLRAPWAGSRALAVAPLLNESGSAHADGVRLADRLTERLNNASGVSTVPVNRVLAEMQRLGLSEVRTDDQARRLRVALGVDGLVAGTVTAFDPYDPPKLGLNLGVFYAGPPTPPRPEAEPDWVVAEGAPDLRRIARAPSPRVDAAPPPAGPVAATSRVWNAADPAVQDALARFARQRGTDYARSGTDARLFRISSDLFADFVAREAAAGLLSASSAVP